MSNPYNTDSCPGCETPHGPATGYVPDPDRKWWQLGKMVKCSICRGSGRFEVVEIGTVKTCGTCDFGEFVGVPKLECRRNAPTKTPGFHQGAEWPMVDRSDHCGQWGAK